MVATREEEHLLMESKAGMLLAYAQERCGGLHKMVHAMSKIHHTTMAATTTFVAYYDPNAPLANSQWAKKVYSRHD